MATLTAKFKLVDEMSDRMEAMANSGQSLLSSWEHLSGAASSSFGTAAAAADGVATSFDKIEDAATGAASSADHWTAAVGNFDKSALEAIYTTEELVEMGVKSADALEDQNRILELCEQAAGNLSKGMDAATGAQEELTYAMETAAEITEQLSKSEDVSAETKATFAKASIEAAEAITDLAAAQEEAETAMASYEATMNSGTKNLGELEAAAERAYHAAENLAEANDRATKATEELSEASNNASEEIKKAGEKGKDAITELEGILAAAGITKMLKEMAESAYELADAFSDAEKTIVLATGATGEALEGLERSMMNVYSTAKSADLSSTASAIGEINTRLGLTDEKLEQVTDLFLDFSNVTGQNVVSSVQKVTKVMNQWEVGLDGLPKLLDELTYAGQMSGISVGSLSDILIANKGILDSLGFTLEESIGLFAKLELQGVNAQTAITGFRSAVNKFAGEGENAEVALQALIEKIVNARSESEATSIAVEYFGSRAGSALASSIRSGQLSIENLTSTLDGAKDALKTTATESQTLSEKWQQASNNMEEAFTNALQPALDKASEALADITNRTAEFLNEHPAVTRALTAMTVGVGIFVGGLVAYTVAVKAADIATKALNATIESNPYLLVATAVIAATAALVSFAVATAEAAEEEEELSYKSQVQRDELEALQVEYEKTCDVFGETSYRAQELKWKIEDLSEEYEANKQTLEEWKTEFSEAMRAFEDFDKESQQRIDEVNLEGDSILNLATRLETLANKTDRSAAEQQEMLAIMEKLNGEIPGLSLNYDDLSGSIEGSTDAIIALAEAEVNRRKYDTYNEQLINRIEKRAKLQNELTDATEQYNATLKKQQEAQAAYNAALEARNRAEAAYPKPKGGGESEGRAYANYMMSYANAISIAEKNLNQLNGELEEANNGVNEATANVEKNDAAIEKLAEDISNLSNNAKDAFSTANTVNEVLDAMSTSVIALAAEYEDAYKAAKTSFDGQFGLFDEAKANMESTVANAQKALDSQLAYWNSYLSNVNILKDKSAADLGITQENYNALMSYVQDGSAEAAGLAKSMVDEINRGNSEAVTKLANTVGEVQARRDEAAGAVAEWQIDFKGKMDEIVGMAEQAVDEMDLSDEAKTAAYDTITAYANEIKAQGGKAIANAKSIASQVQSALSSSMSYTTNISGYAEGTDYATPGPHIVGENGPEIIEFRGGEKVYTNDETERIMARSAAVKFFSNPESGSAGTPGEKSESQDSTRTIRLEINGGGAIDVNGSMDENTVIEIIQANLKPVLTGIVRQEIYEEGDRSYDY